MVRLDARSSINVNSLVFTCKMKLGLFTDYLSLKLTYNNIVHQCETRNKNNFFLGHKNQIASQMSIFFKRIKRVFLKNIKTVKIRMIRIWTFLVMLKQNDLLNNCY